MTDRVLTEKEVEQLAIRNETPYGLPKVDACTLIASHCALHRRHRLLLRRVSELEQEVGALMR